jgi:hypothetical protein
MINIRAVHNVIIIVKSLYSILLVNNLLFIKVVRTLAVVSAHFEIGLFSLRSWITILVFQRRDVSIRVGVLVVVVVVETTVLTIP